MNKWLNKWLWIRIFNTCTFFRNTLRNFYSSQRYLAPTIFALLNTRSRSPLFSESRCGASLQNCGKWCRSVSIEECKRWRSIESLEEFYPYLWECQGIQTKSGNVWSWRWRRFRGVMLEKSDQRIFQSHSRRQIIHSPHCPSRKWKENLLAG